MGRPEWRNEILRMLPKKAEGVEVGVYQGRFSQMILDTANPTMLHLIDPWESRPDLEGALYSKDQEKMDAIFKRVSQRFVNDERVVIWRMKSIEAALFIDEVDFVYLDGDHSYEGVRDDLAVWVPRVKRGGIVCGDDYKASGWWSGGVRQAVDEYFNGTHGTIGSQFFWRKG